MKVKLCIALLAVLLVVLPVSMSAEPGTTPVQASIIAARARTALPLSFEQSSIPGQFLARNGRYAVLVGATESSMAVTDTKSGKVSVVRFGFENADSKASLQALDPLPNTTSYYIGNDPNKWRLGVKSYARLRADAIYPGIDVVYYGDMRRMEFDFVVAPNADPKPIKLQFTGADKLYTEGGDLVAETNGYPVRLAQPVAYQQIDGERKLVDVAYAVMGNRAELKIGQYDKRRELVIDPVVTYATYLGGYQKDEIDGIALAPDGKTAYVTGQTCSPDFPSLSAAVTKCSAFVSHISEDGSSLIGSTVVVGGSNNAWAHAIAVGSDGTAYIVGETNSTDLPTAAGIGATVYSASGSRTTAYFGGDTDAFVAEILNGSITKVAYLGGSKVDIGYGVAIDSGAGSPSGRPNVIATGETCYPTGINVTPDFPAYNGFQRKVELCVGFVTKLDNALNLWVQNPATASWGDTPGSNPPGGQFYFSGYWGGQPPRVPNKTWMPNHAYSKGDVISVTFLVDNNPISKAERCENSGTTGATQPAWSQTQYALADDGSITWRNMGDPDTLVNASTVSRAAAVDALDDVFVAGGSDTGYMACKDCGDTSYWLGSGAWVLKVDKNGGWVYSTVLGDTKTDIATAIAVDGNAQAYVAGTSTGGLHIDASTVTFNSAQAGGQDAFVISLDPAGTNVRYAGYLGGKSDDQAYGIAVDVSGAAYVVGSTKSTDFPAVNALTNLTTNQTMNTLVGSQDAFVTRIIPRGSAISFSSYLGGTGADQAYATAVAQNGEFVLVGGSTLSFDFPTQGAGGLAPFQTIYNRGIDNDAGDAFAAKVPIATLPSIAVNDLNFAPQNIGSTSAAQLSTFVNTGNTAVTIGSITTTGDFAFTDPNTCVGRSLSTNQSCAVSVTFTPTAAGARTGTLNFADSAPGSPHIANLTGTGVSTTGISINPSTPVSFGDQQQGVASSARLFTITNNGAAPATLAFSITGTNASDFSVTNDAQMTCSTGTPLAGSGTCTIAVVFTPSATNARSATLSVSSGGNNLTVALSGNGTAQPTADFTVSAPSSGLTVPRGTNKSLTLTVTPVAGFSHNVSLTCTVPNPATCTVSPTSVTLDGTNAASATLTVTVPASSSGGGGPIHTASLHPSIGFGALGLCAGLALIGRRRKLLVVVTILALLATMGLMVGCGGGSTKASDGSGGMLPGTYSITVTSTYAGTTPLTHTTTIPLIVQ